MVHDPRVSQLLSRLGGIYRDPARVDRDAASLLKSSVGTHLTPILSTMVENNGEERTVLVLQGTIAIHFRGNTYQQLVDMYLPPAYPMRPPVAYVRLAPNMYLKENHRHVGADGKVYLPYLHEWNRNTHNLVELVVAMSSVFSAEPPVFTRAAAPAAVSATTTTTTTASTISSPPPPPPPPLPQQQQPQDTSWQMDSANDAIMQVEIALANEAAEAARRAEQEEREEQARVEREAQRIEQEARVQRQQLEAQRQYDETRLQQIKQTIDTKLKRQLAVKLQECQMQLQQDTRDAQRLELSEQKLKQQMGVLERSHKELKESIVIVDQKTTEIQEWLDDQQQHHHDEQQPQPTAPSADDVVQPASPIYAQMMDLSAENHAISDCLYFLDRALYKGHLDCDTHLKQVRKLAKRQFLVRAHLIKIQQVLLDRR